MYAERSSAGKDGDLEATEAKTDLERNKMLVDKMKLNVPNTESGPPVVINVKGDDGGFDNGEEIPCEFHIDFDHQSGVGRFIQLGCGCKDGLGTVHCHCAEVWFRLKGNRRCEICVCIFVMVCLVLAFVLPWYLCKHNF
ncbi:hypothetical protein AAC387_Pa12g2058 [Persea americana]